jgi:hypothetical protein
MSEEAQPQQDTHVPDNWEDRTIDVDKEPPEADTDRDAAKRARQAANIEKLKGEGVVLISQSPSLARQKFDGYKIVAAYHDAALEYELDVPLLPEKGVALGMGQYGPWRIPMAYDEAVEFADKVKTLVVDGVKLEVASRRVMKEEAEVNENVFATGPLLKPYLKENGCWIELQFEDDEAFRAINRKDVKKALEILELRVFRGQRSQLRMPMKAGAEYKEWKAMGEDMETDKANFTVLPKGCSVEVFPWPKTLLIESDYTGRTYRVKFRIGGEKAEKLCGDWNKCHKLLVNCECKEPYRPRDSRKAAAQDRNQERKRESAEAFEHWQSTLSKSDALCKTLVTRSSGSVELGNFIEFGRCRNGFRCGFRHPGDPEKWIKIHCDRKKGESGVCDAGKHCIYFPCAGLVAARKRARGEGASGSRVAPSTQHKHHV